VTPLTARRLSSSDAEAFQTLRLEGFRLQDREFRYAPEDELHVSRAETGARLDRDFVVGVFSGARLIAIAGLGFNAGVKTRHKTLLWGMYVQAEYRGSGAADMLMSAIVDHARERAESIHLTVVCGNQRAVRFYERWGFVVYGIEPRSIKLADGSYLDETLMARHFD
jgi:ribosomal protein S18 acetylase RimI-like enzyme